LVGNTWCSTTDASSSSTDASEGERPVGRGCAAGRKKRKPRTERGSARGFCENAMETAQGCDGRRGGPDQQTPRILTGFPHERKKAPRLGGETRSFDESRQEGFKATSTESLSPPCDLVMTGERHPRRSIAPEMIAPLRICEKSPASAQRGVFNLSIADAWLSLPCAREDFLTS
jgi:hypothetical protein